MGKIDTPLAWLAVALAVGIAIGYNLEAGSSFPYLFLFCSLGALLISLHLGRQMHPYAYLAVACAAFCAFGMVRVSERLPGNQSSHYLHTLKSQGSVFHLVLQERLKPGAYGSRWVASVLRVDQGGAKGQILVRLPDPDIDPLWQAGDELTAYGIASRFSPPRNPGEFDYAGYMNSLGIPAQLRLKPGSFTWRPSEAGNVLTKLRRLRRHLSSQLEQSGLEPQPLGVLRALLLGDRTGLDPELYQAYQRTGTVHLLAVSGLHVGVVAGLLGWLLFPLRRVRGGRVWHLGLTLLFLWLYAALAGFTPSVVRASFLFSILALALLRGMHNSGTHYLSLAAILMLGLAEPLWLFQPGFQLSFAAVWGILSFYPSLKSLWPFPHPHLRKLGDLLAVSLAAQLGVLPVSLFHFHQFPLLFLIGSVLLVPALGVLLGLGWLLLAMSLTGLYTKPVASLLNAMLKVQNSLVELLDAQPDFLVSGIQWNAGHLILALGTLLLFSRWLQTQHLNWLRASGAFLLGLQCWMLATTLKTAATREWMVPHRVAAQGILFRTGNQAVFYTPSPKRWARMLHDYGKAEGVQAIACQPLKNAYRIRSQRILVVDSTGIYPNGGPAPDYLILSGSPRVHMGRVLQDLKPAVVVADGSNYYGDLDRWARTCDGLGIPFHPTAHKGAFLKEIE